MNWLHCSGIRKTIYTTRELSQICSKKLLRYSLSEGSIEVKCSRCNTINEKEIKKDPNLK